MVGKTLKGFMITFMIIIGINSYYVLTAHSSTKGQFRLGVVTFLSGSASAPFGIPAKNAAELTIESLNNGSMPAPYSKKGFAGMTIKPVFIDEAGGATKQVSEFRELVERKHVNAVVGYISSGDCLAIAPAAERLKTLTVFFDCGTSRIFEYNNYKYVFRTGSTATPDNVGLARYLLHLFPHLKSVAGINQNYAWGHDSWNDFIQSLHVLKPSVKVKIALFPKLFAGQYGSEISNLMIKNPQIIHSSFWGGDLESLLEQGTARGLFNKHRIAAFTCGEASMFHLRKLIPDGTIIGARGPYGVYAPKNSLNTWFRKNYIKRYGMPPTYPSYKIVQAILGLKTAIEKAAAKNKGIPPTTDEIITSFKGLEYSAPSGIVKLSLGRGHQAVQNMIYGQFTQKNGKIKMINVVSYPPKCVNPPEGMTSRYWIKHELKNSICN